ncbi:hypothetical protein DICPUDRAFT_76852 [Dictyostelium purpureum]|uniref:Uncharacterized protein n=1 Tax=Dictyostelium purpureum TaxID=5786 RepID=F0ZEU2_DICPU|nr:uncharacterized protein DICPUDRAFT_76852 [Dictyostelium purpureum]EGC37531.1 hypothetical protein DICPUDRAFT_76852 [Dictyostelium purpureum]|eukprot:XP_003285922.1 hypothetical protein DICPUDRAFT_76852 [Dictyostelium purpureum]
MSVEIVPLPLRIKEDEIFLSYDDRLNRVVLKSHTGFGYVQLDDPEATRKYYPSDKFIKDAKFSPNLKYSATLYSDCDIEILHLENGTRYTQSCKYKSTKGTTIIGFYWTQNDNILLVTNISLELYAMSVDGSCKLLWLLLNEKSVLMFQIKFNCNFGVLFLHSGGTSIQPYFFRSNSFDKLPKFNIEGNLTFNINNLYVTKLHEKFFCVYGDTEYIYLYEMTLETIYKIKPIKIVLPGPNTIHFVDNLIIVHSELKISVVYDLKMIQRDRDRERDRANNKKGQEFPISAIPLTVSLQNSNNINHLIAMATQSPHTSLKYNKNNNLNNNNFDQQQQFYQQQSLQQQQQQQSLQNSFENQHQLEFQLQQQQLLSRMNSNLYSKSWKYICPHYIYDSDTGIWFEVTLNFEKISNFLQFDPQKTIPFLQERTLPSAKFALLALIKTIIEFKTDNLDGIGKIYDDLNKVLFKATNRQLTESLHKLQHSNSINNNQSPNNNNNNNSGGSSLSNSGSGINITGNSSLNSSNENTPTASPSNSFIGNSRLLNGNNSATGNTSSPSSNQNNLSYLRHKQLQQQQQQQQQQQKNTDTQNNNNDEEDPFDLIGDAGPYHSPKIYKSNSLSASSPSSPNSTISKSTLSSSSSSVLTSNNNSNTPIHVVPSRQSRSSQYILINSHDMYDFVFNPIYEKLLAESQLQQHNQQENCPNLDETQKLTLDSKYLIAIVIQYIKSLSFNQCTGISDKLYNLLISLLIDNNMFSKLHQFLQYYVITDSLPIAYKLLSIGEQYPPVLQLSLDMFKRLSMPNIIIETLLERNQVVQAIHLLRSTKDSNQQLYQDLLNPNYPIPFLQVSSNQNNDTLFFSVFKFFETNGLILPHLPSFDRYIKLFVEKFTEKSLSPQLLDSINNLTKNSTPKKTSPALRSSNYSLNNSPKLQSSNI